MAYQQKKHIPPASSKVVMIPNAIAPLVTAFSFIESEKKTKMLINQAAKAIYATDSDEPLLFSRNTTKEEVNSIYALMKSLAPKDMLETLAASQILVCHMLGMRKLAQPNSEDQAIGVKLLRLSNDAMERFEKKRNGGHQNITVTYNNAGPSMQALMTKSPDEV